MEAETRHPLVTIVVLNMNGRNDLGRCLSSIRGLSYPNTETVVVDNGSSDGSQELVRESFSEVLLIEAGVNLGYAGGNNKGARRARGSYLFFLNNDVVLDRGCLDELVEACEKHHDSGIVGCKVYYCKGDRILQHAGGILHKSGSGIMIGQFERDEGQYDVLKQVDWVIGAAFLVTRAAFTKVGGFDEVYHPIYHDEIDLAMSARKCGFKTLYCPKAVVHHCENPRAKAASLNRTYLRLRNRTIFLVKHFGFRRMLQLIPNEMDYLKLRTRMSRRKAIPLPSTAVTLESALLTAVWMIMNFRVIYIRSREWTRIGA